MTTALFLLGGTCALLLAACARLVWRLDVTTNERNRLYRELAEELYTHHPTDDGCMKKREHMEAIAAKRRVLDELRGGKA